MLTISHIRRLSNRLLPDELFTTRDCLSFGSRAAVDKALSRLVKFGEIIRVARGVFAKFSINQINYSPYTVASVKAQAFGKRIFVHGLTAARELNISILNNNQPTFATNGSSSSFCFQDTVIHLRNVSPRMIHLEDKPAGLLIRAMWYLGKTKCTPNLADTATTSFLRSDRDDLRQSTWLMPAWMRDLLVYIQATVYGKNRRRCLNLSQ